jgi:copper transport protein
VLAIASGIGAYAAAPAYGHASLISTDPANGAELAERPDEVRMRFSERVTVIPQGVMLRDSTGSVVATEPAALAIDDPTTVILPMPADLPNGGYVVTFRLSSADSHPVAGSFVFGIAAAAASLEGLDPTSSSGDAAVSAAFAVARWVSYAALALLAGALLFFVLCWPAGWANGRARRVVLVGWVGSVIGAVTVLFLQGPYSSGRPIAAVADSALLAATLDTDFGTYVLIRLGLVLTAAVLVVGGTRLRAPAVPAPPPSFAMRVRDGAALAIGVGLPATWVGTGHANASNSILDKAVDVIHLVAMSAWFGGLALLVVCLLPRSATASIRPDAVGRTLQRFSWLATAAVATLVATGTYLAWQRVGSFAALLGTQYGRLLAVKLAGLGVLLWLGALSRSVVQRRYASTSELEEAARVVDMASVVGGPDRPQARVGRPRPRKPVAEHVGRSRRRSARSTLHQEQGARAELGRSVRLEAGLAVVILAIASILVATPPGVAITAADALARTPPKPVLTDVDLTQEGLARVLVDPAWVGRNRVVVEVLDRTFEPWDVPEVRAALVAADGDLEPLSVDLVRTGPGVYKGGEVWIPFAGQWRLTITVRSTETDSTTVDVTVPVR